MRFAEDASGAEALGLEAGGAGLNPMFFGKPVGGNDNSVAAPPASDPDGAPLQSGIKRDLAAGEEGIPVHVQNSILRCWLHK